MLLAPSRSSRQEAHRVWRLTSGSLARNPRPSKTKARSSRIDAPEPGRSSQMSQEYETTSRGLCLYSGTHSTRWRQGMDRRRSRWLAVSSSFVLVLASSFPATPGAASESAAGRKLVQRRAEAALGTAGVRKFALYDGS